MKTKTKTITLTITKNYYSILEYFTDDDIDTIKNTLSKDDRIRVKAYLENIWPNYTKTRFILFLANLIDFWELRK